MALLACHLHDYIEVACMYAYELNIVMRDGIVHKGRALNIELRVKEKEKEEFLLLQVGDNQHIALRLTDIKSIEAIEKDAKFTYVDCS